MSLDFLPTALGSIDRVHVVDLRGSSANRVSEYVRLHNAPERLVTGDAAQTIANLFRGLGAGQQMRCHIPPFGLRFSEAGKVVLEVSLCWECNNAFGYLHDEPIAFEFDASSDAARALLDALKGHAPLSES
jgi:hypothetical protein